MNINITFHDDDDDDNGDGDGDGDDDSGVDDDDDEDDDDDDDEDEDDDGVGRRATSAADGVVWGWRQAAEAAEMGINRKRKQCRQKILLLRGLLFICTLQRSLVTAKF